MALHDIKNAKVLTAYCEKLGRGGVAERILELAEDMIKSEGKYQSTIIIAGQIQALCVGIKNMDCYWDEKRFIGFNKMVDEAKCK